MTIQTQKDNSKHNALVNGILHSPLGVDTGDGNETGRIYAANDSRFSAGHLSEPLTAYSLGWRDPYGYEELLEWIAPQVPVGRLFEFQKALNSEAFVAEDENDVVRSIGGAFKRVEYQGQKGQSKTRNKGLTIRVDHDDELMGDSRFELYVAALRRRLLRVDLRATMAALSSAATTEQEIWNSETEPKAILRDYARSAQAASGLRPNKLLMGGPAYDQWQAAYEGKATAGGFANAARTPEEIARSLNLAGGGRVSEAVSQESDTNKAAVLGATAFLFYAESGILRDDPTHVKRFTSMTQAGTPFAVYVEQHAKYTDITVEHYNRILAVDTLGVVQVDVTAE